ncbi:alpha/beta hydrolase [Lentzea sp. NPDC034063]|uniref:alpha/beta hydrolase n=1 Tax=unclassified Lentzea TaxID=2643253 RepID=UPI0033CF709E
MIRTWARRCAVAACIVVPPVLLLLGWGPLSSGHPVHLVLLAVVVAVGIAMALWRRVPAWLAVVVAVLLVAPTVYLQPFGATTIVMAENTATTAVLRPDGPVRAGLVFHPGARVDHRAYFPLLRRVAAEGFLVVVVKEPVGIALLGGDTAQVRRNHPDVPVWAVGGHSLGGVAAAQDVLADGSVRGLVLWASYPVDDLSTRENLTAWSISGERDGFTTPQDVAESRKLLPAGTHFEVVAGAVHAYFGDYGDQPGDGVPTRSRAEAQDRIVEHTVAALNDLS